MHTNKRSVTSAEKASVNQCLVHDREHFAKQLKKTVQRHEVKRLSVNELHFFRLLPIVRKAFVPIKEPYR